MKEMMKQTIIALLGNRSSIEIDILYEGLEEYCYNFVSIKDSIDSLFPSILLSKKNADVLFYNYSIFEKLGLDPPSKKLIEETLTTNFNSKNINIHLQEDYNLLDYLYILMNIYSCFILGRQVFSRSNKLQKIYLGKIDYSLFEVMNPLIFLLIDVPNVFENKNSFDLEIYVGLYKDCYNEMSSLISSLSKILDNLVEETILSKKNIKYDKFVNMEFRFHIDKLSITVITPKEIKHTISDTQLMMINFMKTFENEEIHFISKDNLIEITYNGNEFSSFSFNKDIAYSYQSSMELLDLFRFLKISKKFDISTYLKTYKSDISPEQNAIKSSFGLILKFDDLEESEYFYYNSNLGKVSPIYKEEIHNCLRYRGIDDCLLDLYEEVYFIPSSKFLLKKINKNVIYITRNNILARITDFYQYNVLYDFRSPEINYIYLLPVENLSILPNTLSSNETFIFILDEDIHLKFNMEGLKLYITIMSTQNNNVFKEESRIDADESKFLRAKSLIDDPAILSEKEDKLLFVYNFIVED